jgi:hypothetical protein
MHPVLFALAAVAVQDSGAFLVRLGTDTLSLEQYHRTATQVRGEFVIRAPRSFHRLYTADLNPDGTIRRFELISHNIGGGPGPAETKQTIELVGDTAILTAPRGDSTVVTRLPAPRGTVPYALHIYGLLEHIGRLGLAASKDSVSFNGVANGASQLSGGVFRRKGGDTLQFGWATGGMAGLGPFTFRLDRAGRLVWLTGKGSTVQVDVERLPFNAINMAAAGPAFANRPLGQLSARDTARATLGGGEVWVDYSKPSKRGREVFGNVVPWNTVWRTGANAATQLNTTVPLTIGGAAVPPGKYTLWTLPTPTGWKLIINKQTGQWGTEYHVEQDLARVDARVETLVAPVEQFVIAFEPGNAPTAISFTWDKTRVIVPIMPAKNL